MMERGGTVRQRVVEDHFRTDPLDYWYQQEATPLESEMPKEAASPVRGSRLPGGWWIVPALLLSLPAWGALLSFLF